MNKNASWVTSENKTTHFWPEWVDQCQHRGEQEGQSHWGLYRTDGCGPSSTWHRRHPDNGLRYGRLPLPAPDHQAGAVWEGKEEDQVTAQIILPKVIQYLYNLVMIFWDTDSICPHVALKYNYFQPSFCTKRV